VSLTPHFGNRAFGAVLRRYPSLHRAFRDRACRLPNEVTAGRTMLPLFKVLLWFPVRKAALIPVVGISVIGLAGWVGSFDLSRGAARMILRPASGDKRPAGTGLAAASSALLASGAVLAVREAFGKPFVPPPPSLPTDESVPLHQRLKNAGSIMRHVATHFPYKFRFMSIFVAGSASGVAYAAAERYMGVKALEVAPAAAAPAPLGAVAPAPAPPLEAREPAAALPPVGKSDDAVVVEPDVLAVRRSQTDLDGADLAADEGERELTGAAGRRQERWGSEGDSGDATPVYDATGLAEADADPYAAAEGAAGQGRLVRRA